MPNGGPTTIGRESLEAAYRREFSDIWRTKFSATIKTDEVVVSGDYAFARGTDTLTQEVNGKTVHESGKWMATYRRHANGPWKYFWSTYNSNH
jgi:ketosteroid isomerase-like protein